MDTDIIHDPDHLLAAGLLRGGPQLQQGLGGEEWVWPSHCGRSHAGGQRRLHLPGHRSGGGPGVQPLQGGQRHQDHRGGR